MSIWIDRNDRDVIERFRSKTIVIDTDPIGTVDFDLSDEEKDFLVISGRVAALDFLLKSNVIPQSRVDSVDLLKGEASRLRTSIVANRASRRNPVRRLLASIAAVAAVILAFLAVNLSVNKMAPATCYAYAPDSDAADKAQPERQCLDHRIVYVKWIDESAYSAVDPVTGRWPNDRANRAITVTSVEENGTPIWREQNLLRVDGSRSYWQKPKSPGAWQEIVADSPNVIPGKKGTLLRRQDPDGPCTDKRQILEAFLPADLQQQIQEHDVKMCFRWVQFDCANKLPLELVRTSQPFNICVGRIVKALSDRGS